MEKRIPKFLIEEDIIHLKISCRSPREHALLEFLYCTGCRVGEVNRLNIEDINWENCSAIVNGKGSKPVIAAVNGYALGGGFEIVLCCDIILAGQKAKFGLPEALLGLVPGGGGIQKLQRIVGRHIASDLLFTGRRMDAVESLSFGIASQVVPQEELLAAAVQKAKDVAKAGPLAVRELKRLLHEGSEAGFETALSYEQEVLSRLFSSHDGLEGIQAFIEKRKPEFLGK